MAKLLLELIRHLNFQWMKLTGPSCVCSQIIHPGLTCLQQLLVKFKATFKMISKFYVIFHLIPYILKLQKIIEERRLLKSSFKSILKFLGSLMFMIHLVCGLKATLCTISNLGLQLSGKTFLWGGLPTGISIIWQSSSRRQQISYYAFVRSIRAVYIFLKRRNLINFTLHNEVIIPVFLGALCYAYTQNRENLKYSNIFEGLWGKI